MQQGQRANRICGCVENEFGPLRATGILQRNRIHSCASEKAGELFDARYGRVVGLERANLRVAFDVIADMTGSDRMACRKCCSTNDVFHMLGDNLFIADAILYGAHGAFFVKDMRHLGDRHSCVNRFGGDNTEVAMWQLLWVASRIQTSGQISRPGNTQAVPLDRRDVVCPYIVAPNLYLGRFCQMRREETSNRATADYANLHTALPLAPLHP